MTPVLGVFLGSGAFAVPILDALAGSPLVDLRAVVTAPPRPVGRKAVLTPTPVDARATELGIRVLRPERLRAPDAVAELGAERPELLVLADYGQIVPQAVLDLPRHGALNLHPSLLPRHRGATPVPAAILAGDPETGVSLMRMDAGLDTGPIIAQVRLPLDGTEDTPTLEDRLAREAAALLIDTLPGWLAGTTPATPQPIEGATLTRPFRRADGRLDPMRPAMELERQVRALRPWPGTFIERPDMRLIVHEARVGDVVETVGAAPGSLVRVGEGMGLVTHHGLLELLEVQEPGGRRMRASDMARGQPRWLDREHDASEAGAPPAASAESG
ncbi:MAG: methionyl-tRNA formyltransferase [Chloroflexi bacterium]|nr:methionyl-tRNA formyltransferase [Chloroflexota bacterium]